LAVISHCFFYISTFTIQVSAQIPPTLNFKHLTTENGLSQGVVDFMLQDSKGFMWFTSHDGINRFDGTTCLSNEQIGPGFAGGQQTKGLTEDEEGNIWIGSGTGIYRFSYGTGGFTMLSPNVIEKKDLKRRNSFYMPIAYSNGWLLVGRDDEAPLMYNTFTTECRIIPKSNFPDGGKLKSERIPVVKGLARHLHSLFSDKSKVFFIRMEEALPGYYYWKDYTVFNKEEHPEWGNCQFYSVRDSVVVAGTESGHLLKLNLSTGERVVLPKASISDAPTQFIDEQFMLWVGTEDSGVYVYDLKTNALKNHFVHDANNEASLSKHRVQAILKTNDHMIWLSIWGKGVDYARLTDNGFSHHFTLSDARRFGSNNFVRGIVQAKDGTFYANTQFGGIVQLDQQLNYLKTISKEVSASVYIDQKKENIYFGDHTVYRFNLENRRIIPINNLNSEFNPAFYAGSIYQFSDFEKNRILAAGVMNIIEINPELNEISQLPGLSEVFNRQPIYARQVKSGNVYVNTTTEGLLLFKRNGSRYEKTFTFPEKFVTKYIWEENDTTHWIGTTKGLYQFNPVKQGIKIHFNSKNGLPNNVVYAIAPDSLGRVWVSTNKGLASLLKATGKWTTYKNFAGMQGNEYNSHTVVTASDGRIIFGGTNGLTAIRPWEVDSDYPFPTVQITSIKGDSSYNPYTYKNGVSGPITVVAGDNTLEFEFIGIDYNDPSACKLRYRLIGADKNWVESSNPGKARYVKLAPGNYTIEVMAANANGDWSKEIRSVEISIHAFWWQWKWLQALLLTAFIGIIIVLARLQVKRSLYKKQMALEKELSIIRERERITADLHDDVGATLSSLNIYGDLAHSIWEANPEKSKEMVGKIAGQSRELMFRMSDIIWSMKPEGNGTNGLTPRIKNFAQELLSGKGIEVNFQIDETTMATVTNPMVRKNLILIIKEALNNAAKYSEAKKASVLLEKRDEMVMLEISDDGKGFDMGLENKGNGLENMATRCRQMGGIFALQANPGKGTTITCSIPLTIISYNGNE